MDEFPAFRRRRGAGIVTANACTECRKKRSKCDGHNPCARCTAVKVECIYETPVRQSKETMRAEIESLTKYRQQSERLFSSMSHGYKVQETLNRMRNGDSLEIIAEWLEQMALQAPGSSQNVTTFPSNDINSTFGNTLRMAESAASYTKFGDSDLSDEHSGQQPWSPWQISDSPNQTLASAYSAQDTPVMGNLVGTWSHRPVNDEDIQISRALGQQHVFGHPQGDYLPRRGSHRGTWTEVTHDTRLVEHFMALYFCWEYPTFASLCKETFIEDFRAGGTVYCSPLLVNAMLALGCRFSSLPESRADPSDPATSGDHFFAEAKRLLAEDSHTSLTTIQAIGLMSIREISRGRNTESYYYAGQAIRLTDEAGLHRDMNDHGKLFPHQYEEVRATTFWGAFALDQAWSLTVGRLPHFSRAARFIGKPHIIDDIESSEWRPYTDEGLPDTVSANQPSNIRSVCECFGELSELVHQSSYILYSPERRLTSNEVVTVYMRYLNWYSSLPEVLRLGRNFTPAVLFVHLYYHFAILLLFRPFIQLHFINSRISPRDVCSQAADAILTLVRSYDQLYTLKRTPSFVPCMVLSSCTVHLLRASGSSSALSSFRQGANDLKAMCASHGFARTSLNILRFLADEWEAGDAMSDDPALPIEEVKRLCSRSSTSFNFFTPAVNHIPECVRAGTSSTLFSPFPMQGLPLLADDHELERDGFSKIS